MASAEDQAWVTLATNDSYALGALVLGQSLRRVATSKKLVVLITPSVTGGMRDILGRVFDLVQEVNVLDSNDSANLALLTRPDLGITFTKLHCWRLTQYTKCVFLDADTLIIRNCDELFDREELSAAPDVGWPDCFNSGVFVYQPSNETYQSLLQCAVTTGSFDGGDQGLLNTFFSSWATKDIARHLPFIYNMTSSASYSYLPAYQCFGKDVKIVHFIGPVKPWMHRFNATTGRVETAPGAYHALEHLQFWWDIFLQDVKPQLQPELAGLAGQLALITLGQEISPEQKALEDRARQFSWEQGQMDYLGADAFANIQKKLDEALVVDPGAPQPTPVQEGSGEAPAVAPTAPVVESAAPQAPPVEAIPIAPVVLPEVSTLSLAISQEIVSQSLSSVPLEASQVTMSTPTTISASEALSQPAVATTEAAVKPDSTPTPVATQPAPGPPEASSLPSPPPAQSQPQQPASPVTAAPAALSLAVVPCPPPVESTAEPISPPPALPPPPSKKAPPTPPVAEPISPPPPLPPPIAASPGTPPVASSPGPILPPPVLPAPPSPQSAAPPAPGPKPASPSTKGPEPATPPASSTAKAPAPAPPGPTPASPTGKAPPQATPPTTPTSKAPAPAPSPASPTGKAPTPTTPPVASSPSEPLASPAAAASAAEPSQQAAAPPGKAAKGTPQAAGGGAPKQKGGKKPKNP